MAIATATALALAAAAGSAGLTAYNTKKTADRQDRTAADGIRKQADNQRQVNARLNQTISEAQKSNPDDERKTTQGQYLNQLLASMGQAKTGLAKRGISEQFDEQAAGASADIGSYGNDIASLFSRMDAPILQRQGEQTAYGNLGMDLDVMGGNVRGDAFLNDLKLKSIRRNPWLDLAAGLASGYASTGGAGFGGGGSNFGVPAQGSGGSFLTGGSGLGTTWGTGRGLAAAGYGR